MSYPALPEIPAASPGSAHDGFVGVFDSGVGGISVLQALVRELPHERFVYFGDSAHAPYGTKTEQAVCQRSCEIASWLVDQGAKAVVIACNTATSAAAAALRERYPQLPIIGIEPALKPAALAPDHDRILVMATRTTLDLDKFHALARAYGSDSMVLTQACPGLADLVEEGLADSAEMDALLDKLIGKYADMRIDSVVLGCTHYPYLKRQISRILGDVVFFDGAHGTAAQLRRKLEEAGIQAGATCEGSVTMLSSRPGQDELDLYWKLYHTPL